MPAQLPHSNVSSSTAGMLVVVDVVADVVTVVVVVGILVQLQL